MLTLTLAFKMEPRYFYISIHSKGGNWKTEYVTVSSQGSGSTLQAKIVYEVVDVASAIFTLGSCFVFSQYFGAVSRQGILN